MHSNEIGKRIAEKRKKLSMTQRDLANRLHITDRAVSRWERGVGMPDVSLLVPLAEVLQCSVDELLTGKQCGVSKENEAETYWDRWKRTDEERQQRLAHRAPLLGRWLTILLLLFLPVLITENLTNLTSKWPVAGLTVGIVCGAGYALVLLRLATVEMQYRKAAICRLVSLALGILVAVAFHSETWRAVLLLIPAVIDCVGEYWEYMAYSAVCEDLKDDLSDLWDQLWKSKLAAMVLTVFGLLIKWFLASAGMYFRGGLFTIGISLLMAVGIIKMILLYRTAAAFRNYPV